MERNNQTIRSFIVGMTLVSVVLGSITIASYLKIERVEEALSHELQRNSNPRVAGVQTSNNETETLTNLTVDQTHNLGSTIESWSLKTALITCNFTYSSSGTTYLRTRGSGTLNSVFQDTVNVATNKHILLDPFGFPPSYCTVTVANESVLVPIEDIYVSNTNDQAFLLLKNPSDNLKNTSETFKLCEREAKVGEEIVVIGYPGIGSISGVTATEGIISGFEDEYYITSAKVEEGNSGGTAVLQSESCYIGIPTFVRKGGIEALARILKSSVAFPENLSQ